MHFSLSTIFARLGKKSKNRESTPESLRLAPEPARMASLEKAIAYTFKDKSILMEALVHRSYLPNANAGKTAMNSNERQEFLGDAVLSLVVNEYLFRKYPAKSEGDLTKMKSIIVSKQILSHYARELGLGSYILMSENAYKAGVDDTGSVLADTLEAVFGAVFLDGGFKAADRCIQLMLLSRLREIVYNEDNANFKSLLQEYIQALHKVPPHYRVSSTSGPDHDKEFTVEVSVRGRVVGRGVGKTKKLAEQEAAREAYKKLLNTPAMQQEDA
jgi:ribonuclease-3